MPGYELQFEYSRGVYLSCEGVGEIRIKLRPVIQYLTKTSN